LLSGVQRMNEPSHSQVNSHVGSWSPKRTPESLERNCRGQNSLPWIVHYIIGKLLKHICLKWACIAHLHIWNISYEQKKGRESNWQFDSRPLNVRNRPNFLACRWRATYRWKDLDKGYNFALNHIVIGGLHARLCASKVARVPNVGISGLPLGSPGTKNHLDVAHVESYKVYYKGEGCGFPQVQAVVSLVCVRVAYSSSQHQKCSNYAITILCWFCASPCEWLKLINSS
jgi:hypothetical protein